MPGPITLGAFSSRTIPLSEWNHRAHLSVAYLLLRENPFPEAIERMRAGVQAYNAANGIAQTPTGGYHDTLTIAWMQILHATMQTYGPGEPPTPDAFLDAHTHLHSKLLLRLYYSRERMMSHAARHGWVEPDLAPLPSPPGAGAGSASPSSESRPPRIAQFALVVREYDEAIAFFVGKLGFELVEDSDLGGGKRWVRVQPARRALTPTSARGADEACSGAALLLARATTPEQSAAIGRQAGGRVFGFLETDDFERDFKRFIANGVQFCRPPQRARYGKVAVFEDLYGNRWDLIQSAARGG